MSQDQARAAIAGSYSITGLEIYSSIRNFQRQHDYKPGFQNLLNDHLMEQIHVLLRKQEQAKNDSWIMKKTIGVARAKIATAKLREERDTLHVEELQAEIAFLKRDAAVRHAIRGLQATRQQEMIGDSPDDILLGHAARVRVQAKFDAKLRRLEDLTADNSQSWETTRQDLVNRRLALSAEIMRIPYILEQEMDHSANANGLYDPFKIFTYPELEGVRDADRINQTGAGASAKMDGLDVDSEKLKHSSLMTKEDEISPDHEERPATSDAPTVIIREDDYDSSAIFEEDGHADDSMTTAVDDTPQSTFEMSADDNKENRPVVSTPPVSPAGSKKRRFVKVESGDLQIEDGSCSSSPMVKQESDSPREVLGVLYDESDEENGGEPQHGEVSEQSEATDTNPRKRRADDDDGEESPHEALTEIESPVEDDQDQRRSKRRRRPASADARINEG